MTSTAEQARSIIAGTPSDSTASWQADVVAELFEETLTQVGSSFSKAERTQQEIDAYAGAMADMFNAYLAVLA